jgi:hypothetical protein
MLSSGGQKVKLEEECTYSIFRNAFQTQFADHFRHLFQRAHFVPERAAGHGGRINTMPTDLQFKRHALVHFFRCCTEP